MSIGAGESVRRNAGNTAFEAYTPSGGMTIGNAIAGSPVASGVLFADGSGNLANSNKFKFDGSDLFLINPTAATAGTQSQDPPYLYLNGSAWRSDTSAAVDMKVRLGHDATANGGNSFPKFAIEAYSIVSFAWQTLFSITPKTGDNATTQFKLASPLNNYGGIIEVTYDGLFAFKDLSGSASGGIATGKIGLTTNSAFPAIELLGSFGRPTFNAYFGEYITFDSPAGKTNGTEYIRTNIPFGYKTTPSVPIHVIETTEQLRLGYDSSNYWKATTASNGAVTFDAVGSGAGFTFSDGVTINGSLTLSARNIVTDTTTGMKIGTGTTQKLGFFNATPVVQRTDSGALTDSTGGSVTGTISEVSATYDEAEHNANYASLTAKINALRTALRDLGLMA